MDEIMDWFKEMNKQMDMNAAEDAYQRARQLSDQLYGLYRASQDSGFTADQAFKIVLTLIGDKPQ